MGHKRRKPEKIATRPRQVEMFLGQGMARIEATARSASQCKQTIAGAGTEPCYAKGLNDNGGGWFGNGSVIGGKAK